MLNFMSLPPQTNTLSGAVWQNSRQTLSDPAVTVCPNELDKNDQIYVLSAWHVAGQRSRLVIYELLCYYTVFHFSEEPF